MPTTAVDGARKRTPGGTFYLVEGEELPSVTTILSVISKPALHKWIENTTKAAVIEAAADLYVDLQRLPSMSRVAYVASLEQRLGRARATERESQKALEIGSQAHALIEWTLRRQLGQVVGPRPASTPPAEWAFMAFEDWAKSVDLRPIFIEQTVWSRTHRYAGTMDVLAEVQGQRTLVDFKTSKGIYAEYELQAAAYQHALETMGHGLCDGGALIVRLPKLERDPAFEVHRCRPADELMPTFIAARALWQWWHDAEQASKRAWLAKKAATA